MKIKNESEYIKRMKKALNSGNPTRIPNGLSKEEIIEFILNSGQEEKTIPLSENIPNQETIDAINEDLSNEKAIYFEDFKNQLINEECDEK